MSIQFVSVFWNASSSNSIVYNKITYNSNFEYIDGNRGLIISAPTGLTAFVDSRNTSSRFTLSQVSFTQEILDTPDNFLVSFSVYVSIGTGFNRLDFVYPASDVIGQVLNIAIPPFSANATLFLLVTTVDKVTGVSVDGISRYKVAYSLFV